VIQLNQISLRRGPKLLLDHSALTIYPQERVGFVGPNGAGKSSLFALLSGALEPDHGQLSIPADWQLAQVEQQITTPERPAIEFVIDGDQHLRNLQRERAAVDLDDGEAIALLETALNDAGAWSANARAEQLLSGLGFAPEQWQWPVRQFSGGWQMRLALARALMAPSDLLLLDEPTNHLDLDAMFWLERWLSQYPGTVLVISHDTEFLDAVCEHIVHFHGQKLERYRGNYSSFQRQRLEKEQLQAATLKKQQQKIAHLQHFVDRFRAQASKAKQAQSRLKALAKIQPVIPLATQDEISIHFENPDFMPDPLLRLELANLGYSKQSSKTPQPHSNASLRNDGQVQTPNQKTNVQGSASEPDQGAQSSDKTVLTNVNLTIRAGSRLGILGMNGAGKSTLIKTLAGQLDCLTGQRIAAQQLRIGYFAQQQLDMLDINASPLDHMQRLAPDTTEVKLRSYLGRFAFQGNRATEAITHFSGGEKARLALALVVWENPNLLLLDEPTNHLDIDTRNALIEALTDYEGSVVIVSHDRQLLRQTVDEFWLVSEGKLRRFDGDLEDYKQWFFQQLNLQRNQARNRAQEQVAASTGIDDGHGKTLAPTGQPGAAITTGTATPPLANQNLAQAAPGHEAHDPAATTAPVNRREQRRQAAALRQQRAQLTRPIEAAIRDIEQRLEKYTAERDTLHEKMSSDSFYNDEMSEERAAIIAREGQLSKEIAALEEEWLEQQEKLESIKL